MVRTRIPLTATAVLLVTTLLLQAQAGGQEFKGQVKIGMHKVKLEANKIYEVILDSPKDLPLGVTAQGIQLNHQFTPDFRGQKIYCMPSQAGDFNFFVSPGFGVGNFTTYDYVLKIKGMALAEKPLLQESGKWTGQDPIYKQGGAHYKDYKIELKGGRLYIIDLVKGGPNLDPYLYLEGPTGMVVAQDDDSGGDLNARIIYSPPQDGEFRIIATTLGKSTGDFTLTVRQAE